VIADVGVTIEAIAYALTHPLIRSSLDKRGSRLSVLNTMAIWLE